jgi:hypothetical protein
VNLEINGETVRVAGPTGSLLRVEPIEASSLPPLERAELPLGALAIDVADVEPAAIVTIEITLERSVNAVRKLVDGSWDPFEFDGTTGATLSADGRSIMLVLQDGGRGDTDGVADGRIVDPVAPVDLLPVPECAPVGIEPAAELHSDRLGFTPGSYKEYASAGGDVLYHWTPTGIVRTDLITGVAETIRSGLMWDWSVSPDGTTVASSSGASGGDFQIWRRGEGVVRSLPGIYRVGEFSPDGSHVGLSGFFSGSGLTLVPVDGSAFVSVPVAPSFSAQIAPDLQSVAWPDLNSSPPQLKVWDRTTNSTRNVTTLPGAGEETILRYTADGKIVVGAIEPAGAPTTPNATRSDDVFVIDPVTAAVERIDTGVIGGGSLRVVAVSADLSGLVLGHRTSGAGELPERLESVWAWHADKGPVLLNDNSFGQMRVHTRAFDGEHVVFSATRMRPSGIPYAASYVATLEENGSDQWCEPPATRFAFEPPSGTPDAPDVTPGAIPEGVTVLYQASWDIDEGPSRVNEFRVATSGGSTLMSDPLVFYAAWDRSADVTTRRRITQAVDSPGRWLLCDVDAGGADTNCEVLVDDPGLTSLGFSPDGQLVGFARAGTPNRVEVIDLASRQVIATAAGGAGAFQSLVWRPDSGAVAVSTSSGIDVLDLATNTVRTVVTGAFMTPLSWSQQGRIAFGGFEIPLSSVHDSGADRRAIGIGATSSIGVLARYLPDGRLITVQTDPLADPFAERRSSALILVQDAFDPEVTWLQRLSSKPLSTGPNPVEVQMYGVLGG